MVGDAKTPYSDLPETAFWRTGVAEVGPFGLCKLWASKWRLPADARFATFGSCFAQHMSRALVARRMNWLDGEPAPGGTPADLAHTFNYGVFSARTGNVYTAAQLLALVRMAAGEDAPDTAEFWPDAGRWRDSLRPTIEPQGFASEAEAMASRRGLLNALRAVIEKTDVFVFTLGLTEGWESLATGQPYAMCPGTAGGRFDPELHGFVNYRAAAIRSALERAFALLRELNPELQILLTVSPVPLTATASGRHVLVATTHSKSVLRAVAGELAADHDWVDYFPSYEIISGAPTRAMFFEPNLRSVAQAGVDLVMQHFFAGLDCSAPAAHGADAEQAARVAAAEAAAMLEELVCDERALEVFNGA